MTLNAQAPQPRKKHAHPLPKTPSTPQTLIEVKAAESVQKQVDKCPKIRRPSGLSMGGDDESDVFAHFLAGWSLLMTNSIRPWHKYEAGFSPGWTRAVMHTTLCGGRLLSPSSFFDCAGHLLY